MSNSNATMKVSLQTRERIKFLAERSGKTMAGVVEDAMKLYESQLQEKAYLEGWARFQEEDPQGFAAYLLESEQLERGLTDAVPL